MELCFAGRGPGTGGRCLGGEVEFIHKARDRTAIAPNEDSARKPLDRMSNPCWRSTALRELGPVAGGGRLGTVSRR